MDARRQLFRTDPSREESGESEEEAEEGVDEGEEESEEESKKVFGRSSIFRYKLADRLAQKVEQTETVRGDYIQSIRAFDRLKAEIIQLTRKITAAEDENQADSNIPKLIERSAADLSTKVSNAYAEFSTKRSPKDFDALVKDLRYYAGKRSEW